MNFCHSLTRVSFNLIQISDLELLYSSVSGVLSARSEPVISRNVAKQHLDVITNSLDNLKSVVKVTFVFLLVCELITGNSFSKSKYDLFDVKGKKQHSFNKLASPCSSHRKRIMIFL